jgi:alpha-ribazole phosphatase
VSLWLVRHGKPLVAPGTCYGMLDLDAEPAATHAAAVALAEVVPRNAVVLSSPLKRCLQLAHRLEQLRPDLPSQQELRLREMDFGAWEGVAWDAIPRAAVDAWTADFASHRFGGKESAGEVLARIAQVWDSSLTLQASQGRDVVWITHAGVAQAATLIARGTRVVERSEDWPLPGLHYGAWLKF